ncbi:DUF1622 domain-containing protein [Mycobacterium sp.]|uniref:DUF1622 domain-containing protein n=1 Tax=Mycobacterium sp. TaxID=1785 RepID=UPI0028B720C2|nr:putative rane protein [Mycobacterium sp.]MDT5052485.1 hypothetical protein [Mycobacterium sp.]HYR17268.1 DUF1622 domain-containing protein [Mycobacterium sp.]
MSLDRIIEGTGTAIDAIGVAVIAGGALLAVVMTVGWNRREGGGSYDFFRRRLGRAILLGLEFLVAADIIRTVAVTPSAESVAVLAGIVLIRTFLSFSLQLEMTGAWPWQQRSSVATDKSHGRSAE